MFATLSAEARIQAGLNDLAPNDLTTGRLSEYTENVVSQTRLSLALSGTKALENSHGILVLETLAGLKSLVQSAHPLPISLKNVTLIKKLLADRRHLQRRTPEPRLFSVCIDGRWFIRRDNQLFNIITTIAIVMAAAMTSTTAELLIAALKNNGIDAEAHANPFADRDSMGQSFESLWGLPPQQKKEIAAPVVETNIDEFEAQ